MVHQISARILDVQDELTKLLSHLEGLAAHDAGLAASADRFELLLDSAGQHPRPQSDSSVGDSSAKLRSQTPGAAGAQNA